MGLMQEMEKLREIQTEEVEKPEADTTAEDTAQVDGTPDDTASEDTTTATEDTAADDVEVTDDTKAVEKPAVDNVEMARIRRENAAMKKRLEEAAAAPRAEPKAEVKAEVKPVDAEPDPDDLEEHLKWQNRQLSKKLDELDQWRNGVTRQQQEADTYSRAINNFTRMEREYMQTAPDYNKAADHMVKKMAEGAQLAYPAATAEQVQEFVRNQVLTMADRFVAQGLNPVEELHTLAKTRYGFTGEQAKADEPKTAKTSVKTIAENRNKSITSLNGGGSDKKTIDPKSLTPAMVSKMSPQDRQVYLQSLK